MKYTRFNTRIVKIGNIEMGGHNPIRIQSMTNTKTMDTVATAAQVISLYQGGAEYVRITASNIKEAENLAEIKKIVRSNNIFIPLIADVHFNPKAAEIAAQIVEKVRINPGNFVDRNLTDKFEYTDNEYSQELEKIATKLHSLIKICKTNGTVLRIGVNHGSLSQRIISRYGNTNEGMVE